MRDAKRAQICTRGYGKVVAEYTRFLSSEDISAQFRLNWPLLHPADKGGRETESPEEEEERERPIDF